MNISALCTPWFVEVIILEIEGLNDLCPCFYPFASDNIRWQPEEMVTFEVAIKVTPESNRIQGPSEQSSYSVSVFGEHSAKEYTCVWGICSGDFFFGDVIVEGASVHDGSDM